MNVPRWYKRNELALGYSYFLQTNMSHMDMKSLSSSAQFKKVPERWGSRGGALGVGAGTDGMPLGGGVRFQGSGAAGPLVKWDS